ncbi:MAG: hypothetical protein ACK5CK_04685 [Burkholderiaceae bacterium]
MPVNKAFYPASLAIALLASAPITADAGDDVKVLLELLLEKGVITQEEFDQKLKVAREKEEIRAFNEAQDIRRANREIDKRAEDERKFKTQIYGQGSAGYYQASNMTSANLDASGMSDQPKANNRVGLKVSRELDPDNTVMVTLESNFSARTGAVGVTRRGTAQPTTARRVPRFLIAKLTCAGSRKSMALSFLGVAPTCRMIYQELSTLVVTGTSAALSLSAAMSVRIALRA